MENNIIDKKRENPSLVRLKIRLLPKMGAAKRIPLTRNRMSKKAFISMILKSNRFIFSVIE